VLKKKSQGSAGFANFKATTMKTIGLLGGMSWQSTIPYYRIINETVKQQLGGLHSAKVILYSVNFAEIEQMQRAVSGQGAARVKRTVSPDHWPAYRPGCRGYYSRLH
tara:strand:+ start:126451 stop:126771 length:321 start_codon:yes stop_codon:yes gene_type:complete